MTKDIFNYDEDLALLASLGWCASQKDTVQESAACVIEVPTPSARDILSQLGVEMVFVDDATLLPRFLQASHATLLGIDSETYAAKGYADDKQAGLSPRKSEIRLVQLYDGEGIVYVFDILKLGGLHVLGDAIWACPMVAHNAKFELTHLLRHRVVPQNLGCSLLADRVLNGSRMLLKESLGLSKKAGLKDLAKELLGIDISKEQQTSDWSIKDLSQEQIEYAALDAVLAVKLFDKQWPQLRQQGLVKAYRLLRNAQYAVARMELCGIGFDVQAHKQMIEEWKAKRDELHATILDAIGRELNLNSGKQVDLWLKEALEQDDLDAWAKTAKGQLSTSTHTFNLNQRMHDVFPMIVEYRHVAKRISSFGDSLYKFIDEKEGRLYGAFSLGTTTTGRMASSKPNMQNMPRGDFRKLFCARDGYVLIGLDYSQQELRAAALISNDTALLSVYERGEDAHTATAARVLNISLDKVEKQHRQMAKALNFGLLYGMGAAGLAKYAKQGYGVEWTEKEAIKHRDAFFKAYRGLRAWQKRTGSVVEVTQKSYTPGGRVRDFSKEKLGYQYTAALNLPIQGASAEIMLRALTRISPMLDDACRLVNVVHDEIVLEVQESMTNVYLEKAKEAMELAFLDVFTEAAPYMQGLVDAKIGKNWGETK